MTQLRDNKTTATRTVKYMGVTALLAVALNTPLYANPDERYENYEPPHPHRGEVYIEERPFRVYVNIRYSNRDVRRDSRRYDPRDRRRGARPSERRHDRREWRDGADLYKSITMRKLSHELPRNILLVDSPAYADMTVKVRETDYALNFRVTDMDQKDKKYKKNRKITPGPCGIHHRAFYTRVEEKGEAQAYYSVKYDLKGLDRDLDTFRIRASEKYRYGQNLTASTNCGVRPTNNLPSNGVAKLFSQAHPSYRQHVTEEIRIETAEDLGQKLARKIRSGANHFYTDLEQRKTYGAYRENSYHRHDRERAVAALVARIILD